MATLASADQLIFTFIKYLSQCSIFFLSSGIPYLEFIQCFTSNLMFLSYSGKFTFFAAKLAPKVGFDAELKVL